MNTGAEAVETAIKTARRWGYEVKGVPDGRARIVVMAGNFHGRTTTIISFSDDPVAHDHYGPYTPGFDMVPFGDIGALEAAITDDTVAVLLEPIQGEGGVILPPRRLAARRARPDPAPQRAHGRRRDPVRAGPHRHDLRLRHRGRRARHLHPRQGARRRHRPGVGDRRGRDVLGVFTPGSHGSTFGGNPLAAAVGPGGRRAPRDRRVPAAGAAGSGRCSRTASRRSSATASSACGAAGCGRASTSTRRLADRAGGLAPAPRARRARQGHPRLDGAPRSAPRRRASRRSRSSSTPSVAILR